MFCGFYLALHTLGSCDIFSRVGIWVFDVKTRIYCQGVKNLNRTPKNACLCEGVSVILTKIRECWRLASGMMRCLMWNIWITQAREKDLQRKYRTKKWVHGSKDVGFIKKPTFSCGLSTEWYFWNTPL